MKRIILTALCALVSLAGYAQDEFNRLKIDSEVRVDHLSGDGFTGNSLNLSVQGRISDDLTFHIKHRFNKANSLNRYFSATDWAYLDYRVDDNWNFSAGKQVVALGGMEYNTAPVDMYFSSMWWAYMPCYEFGVSGSYTFASKNDILTLQVCQSPYASLDDQKYAVNFHSVNRHGWYHGNHSFSVMQTVPDRWYAILATGNEFRFGNTAVQADATLRYADDHCDPLSDFTLGCQLTQTFSDEFSAFVKASYDSNGSLSDWDPVIGLDTDVWSAGLGVECYPSKYNRNIRLHAVYYHRSGDYYLIGGDSSATVTFDQDVLNVGITWWFNFFNL